MWNPYKILKHSYKIFDMKEDTGADYDINVKHLVELYSEVLFPSNIFLVRKLRKTQNGRNILDGVGYYSKEWQEDTYVPMLSDKEFLNKLKPNTIGAHYAYLLSRWSLQELYERRFTNDREDLAKIPTFITKLMRKILKDRLNPDEVRENIARHIFLSHDFWHVLFRYDTSPLGEACVQAITHQYLRLTGPWYLSYLVALRESVKDRSLKPFAIIREAHKLGKAAKQDLYELNYLDALDADIETTRKKYNIGAPVKFMKYMIVNPRKAHNDCIHPEYNDPILRLVAEPI
jgi:ubiquinone biosynthesis protein Coq4